MRTRLPAAALVCGLGGAALVAVYPGDSLAAHMASHALVVSTGAPLLALGFRLAYGRGRGAARLLHPVATWLLFVGVQWALHVGPLFPRGLEQPLLHQVEHALLLATGVLFWLPIVGPTLVRARMDGPERTLYLFLALPATDLIGLWFMASGRAQAGTAMIVAMLPLAAAAFLVTWSWLGREEARMVRTERYGGSPG